MAEAFPERVTEDEILALARDIPHDQFLAIGQRLGFHLQELENWKQHDYKHDFKGACEHMLIAWRNRDEFTTKERLLTLIAGSTPGKPLTPPEGFMSKCISANLTVLECQQRLADFYKKTARIQLQPGQARKTTDFKDLHTKIRLHKKNWTDRGQRISKEVLEGSIDDIFVTEVDGEYPSRIALLGTPGCGKTTSLAKLAHDWAVDENSPLRRRFTLLFWLKFREMKRDCSLGEAIVSKLLQKFKGVTKDEMESFITNNGDRCGVLLDGYDEFGRTIESPDSPTSVVDMLRFLKFPDCRVVVSSRPNLASHFETGDLSKVYAVMELEEFGKEDRKQYISKYFADDPLKGHRLLEYLTAQHNLITLIRIPFFCMVLCTLWRGDRLVNVETASNMMVCFLEYLAAHAIAKKTSLRSATDYSTKHLTTAMAAIGKVAYKTLLKDSNQLIINKEEFDGCQQEFHFCIHLGLLHSFDKDSDKPLAPNVTCCEFYHKLAQEHCAGVYLATLTHHELEEKLSLISSSQRVVEFEHVLRFAAESAPLSYEPFIRLITMYKPGSIINDYTLQTLVLDIVGISAIRGLDEQLRSSNPSNPAVARQHLLQLYFSDSILIEQASTSTIVGIGNLSSVIKNRITHIRIDNSHLRPELLQRLRSCLSDMTGLERISLIILTIDDESAVNLVDTCRSLGNMWYIGFMGCNIPEDGILHRHLAGLHHPRGNIIVYVHESSYVKDYSIPRVSR